MFIRIYISLADLLASLGIAIAFIIGVEKLIVALQITLLYLVFFHKNNLVK